MRFIRTKVIKCYFHFLAFGLCNCQWTVSSRRYYSFSTQSFETNLILIRFLNSSYKESNFLSTVNFSENNYCLYPFYLYSFYRFFAIIYPWISLFNVLSFPMNNNVLWTHETYCGIVFILYARALQFTCWIQVLWNWKFSQL